VKGFPQTDGTSHTFTALQGQTNPNIIKAHNSSINTAGCLSADLKHPESRQNTRRPLHHGQITDITHHHNKSQFNPWLSVYYKDKEYITLFHHKL